MRRTYISPEFLNNSIYGSFNMIEESNFFGSKMIDVDDEIYVDNQNLIYYQKSTGEQIDISVESSLESTIFSYNNDKKTNHTINIDDSQGAQISSNTRWIININTSKILTDTIFAKIKKNRTFEGVSNLKTIHNDVNTSINEYISNNVYNRYKYYSVDFYIKYYDLKSNDTLRFESTWNPDIYSISNKTNKFSIISSNDDSSIKIIFNQEKPSTEFKFDYYFNVLYKKI